MAAEFWRRRHLAALLVAAALLFALAWTMPSPGSAVPARVQLTSSFNYRWHAYLWALFNESGHWYCWGGSAGCYDCSGAVMAGYAHVGIWLPHNTVAMLGSGKLEWIPASQARAGDLAFYGTGHVEFYSGHWGWTFGAQDFGTVVGMHQWSQWWHPTAFYRVL